jgi:hypothetical protein
MAMKGSGGGGYGSRNVKHVTAPKVETQMCERYTKELG